MAVQCEIECSRAQEAHQATTDLEPGDRSNNELFLELFGDPSDDESSSDDELFEELFGPNSTDLPQPSQATNAMENQLSAPRLGLALPPLKAATIVKDGEPTSHTGNPALPSPSTVTDNKDGQPTGQRSRLALPPTSAATFYTNGQPTAHHGGLFLPQSTAATIRNPEQSAAPSRGLALPPSSRAPSVNTRPSKGKAPISKDLPSASHHQNATTTNTGEISTKKRRRSDSSTMENPFRLPKVSKREGKRPGNYLLCRYCSTPLAGAGGLRAHMHKIHNLFKQDAVKAKCGICQKQFATEAEYDNHCNRETVMCKRDSPEEWNVPYPRTRQECADTWALKADGEVSPHLRVTIDEQGEIVGGMPLIRRDSLTDMEEPAAGLSINVLDFANEHPEILAFDPLQQVYLDVVKGLDDHERLDFNTLDKGLKADLQQQQHGQEKSTVMELDVDSPKDNPTTVPRKQHRSRESAKIAAGQDVIDLTDEPLDVDTFGEELMAELMKSDGSMQDPIVLE